MESILIALGVVALLWVLYRGVKGNKEAFSSENVNKSLKTLGFLALLLIVIIALAVMALR